ncbi:peptide-methionine (S)-S-oxide reductase [Vibrio syngnathi]|uniref:Peptide methionine sulfoxide reductase MsrA n=1 Tax=Vibrio syngnathi TaxID=3034029 RepID=A0AA34TP36_9VIBR|nr:peptide-methionine (S)-S-oxide reductase [Vibrio syngnathi]ARP38005.1 Peptide methionine sulfoxide reductase msrA/msrB [Vibrio syngnathi]
MEQIYLAGGCLWGVQEFIKYVPGVINTEAGRANGSSQSTEKDTSQSDETQNAYDGYAECVQIEFDPSVTSVMILMKHLFEIIDPYSVNKQGVDVGEKYRTGVYSTNAEHLTEAKHYIASRDDADRIALEILPLTSYVASDDIHQHHLSQFPEDHHLCNIPWDLLHKYKAR